MRPPHALLTTAQSCTRSCRSIHVGLIRWPSRAEGWQSRSSLTWNTASTGPAPLSPVRRACQKRTDPWTAPHATSWRARDLMPWLYTHGRDPEGARRRRGDRSRRRASSMHNRVVISKARYHGSWMTEVTLQLRGHYEPHEEPAFHTVLERLATSPESPIVVELGSFGP